MRTVHLLCRSGAGRGVMRAILRCEARRGTVQIGDPPREGPPLPAPVPPVGHAPSSERKWGQPRGRPHGRPACPGLWSRQASGSAPGELLLRPGGSKSWDRIRSADLRRSVPKQSLPRVVWGLDGSSSDDCLPLAASAVRHGLAEAIPAGFPTLLAGIAAAPIGQFFSVQFQGFIPDFAGWSQPLDT